MQWVLKCLSVNTNSQVENYFLPKVSNLLLSFSLHTPLDFNSEIAKQRMVSNKNDVIHYKWPMIGKLHTLLLTNGNLYTGLSLFICLGQYFFNCEYTESNKIYLVYKGILTTLAPRIFEMFTGVNLTL